MLLITLLGFLIPGMSASLALTPEALTRGHVWRLVTNVLDQAQVLSLLFTVVVLATQGPMLESKMGSLRYLLQTCTWAAMINVSFVLVAVRPRRGVGRHSSMTLRPAPSDEAAPQAVPSAHPSALPLRRHSSPPSPRLRGATSQCAASPPPLACGPC